MKERPGDQPLPEPANDSCILCGDEHTQPSWYDHPWTPDVQTLVVREIEERRQVGIQRYGQALRPNNGRNTLRDLYEELMDATIYIRSAMLERDSDHRTTGTPPPR